ncbi:MAG TPA: helix-turn-helix domain-containing protein, partial [Chloroflexota bacterium]
LRFTTEAERCVDLRQLGPQRYLEFSADSVGRRLAAQRAGALLTPGAVTLADTVLMYVEGGLNTRVTAERLGVHLNTVHNRLERAAEVLAQPELSPIDLVETAIAIRICRSAAAAWTSLR